MSCSHLALTLVGEAEDGVAGFVAGVADNRGPGSSRLDNALVASVAARYPDPSKGPAAPHTGRGGLP